MRSTIRPRLGLTLLEVLISTAILATLAGVIAPTIARAMASLQRAQAESTLQIADLASVADAFIQNPEQFGCKDAPLHAITQLQIDWPVDDHHETEAAPPGPPTTVSALRDANSQANHLWLRFDCAGLSIMRWVAVPPASGSSPSPAPQKGSPP